MQWFLIIFEKDGKRFSHSLIAGNKERAIACVKKEWQPYIVNVDGKGNGKPGY